MIDFYENTRPLTLRSVKSSDLTSVPATFVGKIVTMEPIPPVEPIPEWNRLQHWLFFSLESAAPIPT